MSGRAIRGILFDKDGTLFDFRATWDGWAARVVSELGRGDAGTEARIARAIHFDRKTGRFLPSSPVIAGTNREAAELVAGALLQADVAAVERRLAALAAEADLRETVPLRPLLGSLREGGLKLGVMTNDTEAVARAHTGAAGVAALFELILGFDSGHGAKPAPGPLLAFARHCGLAPEACAMVGDSAHDLHAARAAGMVPVAVLTGVAEAAELAPLAAAVLPDIGHLPEWLAGGQSRG